MPIYGHALASTQTPQYTLATFTTAGVIKLIRPEVNQKTNKHVVLIFFLYYK